MRWESSRHLRLRRGDKRSQGTTIWRTKRKRPDPGLHGSWLSQRARIENNSLGTHCPSEAVSQENRLVGVEGRPVRQYPAASATSASSSFPEGLANMEVRMSPHPSVGLTHQKLLANEQRHDSARGGGELQRPARNGHIA